MQLNNPHDPFISYFRIFKISQDMLNTPQDVGSKGSCFGFKILWTPLCYCFVLTAQMIFIGNIYAHRWIPTVKSDPLVIIIYFYHAFGVVNHGVFADIAIRYAIVSFIRREVDITHFLDRSEERRVGKERSCGCDMSDSREMLKVQLN